MISGIKISPLLAGIKGNIQGKDFPSFCNMLRHFGKKNINIHFAVQLKNNEDLMNVTLCVDYARVKEGTAIISRLCPGFEVSILPSLNIISAFPFRNNPEIAFIFIKAIEDASISSLAVSTSLSSISCLVHHKQCQAAKESLEKVFGLI